MLSMVLVVALAGATLAMILYVAGRPRADVSHGEAPEGSSGRVSRLTEPQRLMTRW